LIGLTIRERARYISVVGWGNEITTLKAVPAEVGDGWRIFIQWASGRMQYISGFESLDDAENWIKNEAQGWLRALETQL
jgi:hypothetical protein